MDFHQPQLREISVHGGSHLIDVHGCPWVSMEFLAHGQLCIHQCPWMPMGSFVSINVHGSPWKSIDAHQCPSVSSSLPKKASGSTLFWVGPSASSQPGMSLWQLYGLWAIL